MQNQNIVYAGYYTFMTAVPPEFYAMPKYIFSNMYRHLSSDAKILYSFMLDRVSLSIKNKWEGTDKMVYIYYTVAEVMEALGVSNKTAVKAINALADEGLILKEKQGRNKPVKIYVRYPLLPVV